MSISNAFVEIQNFKSIEKRKVQLEKGVTLLKGASGAGKSTTLESVLYAITGAPRTCKSMDRPTAATRVKFTFTVNDDETWSICRSTRPRRLTLERSGHQGLVEDDEAQPIIDDLFGQQFATVSHIPQNTSRSFMCMAPSAKLDFLEGLTFGKEAARIKDKSKQYLKDKKKEATRASAEYDVFEKELKRHPPVEKSSSISPPIKPDDIEDEKQIQRDKQEARIAMKRHRETIDELSEKRRRTLQKRARTEAARQKRKIMEKEYAKISSEIQKDAEQFEVDEDGAHESLESAKEALAASRKLNSLRAQTPEWAKQKDSDWEQLDREWEKKKVKELEKNQTLIEIAENKDTNHFDCPSCSVSLQYNRTTDTVSIEDSSISASSTCKPVVNESLRDLMRRESRLKSELEKRKRERREFAKAASQIKSLTEEWGDDALDDTEELENTVDELKQLVFKISRKAQIEQNLKRVVVDGSEPDSDTSEDAIQALDDRICAEKEKLNEKRDTFERADALLDTWNAWRREQEKYERRLAELDMRRKARENAEKNERKAAEKLKEASLALKGAEELKSAVLEAESLALVSLVNQINDHAATYLDVFFAEDPIEASLKTFTALKGKKKMKPSIQTEIQFKGNEMKLDGLSGGEQARVVVAFNLALCEILASPIIMLDEVTANLDADLTETIYDTIKASTDNKIVLAVAHQCIDGTFDQIIRIC